MTNVRYFSLVNGNGVEVDMTTTDIFFSEPSGLGYERTESYRQIGNSFIRINKQPKQGSITGTLIFTPPNAYQKYWDFVNVIKIEPLKLKYKPYTSSYEKYRDVTITKLEKGELTKYASLECSITFSCLTPWYRIIKFAPSETTITGNVWPITWPKVWGSGSEMSLEFDSDSILDSPCKLIINGHCKNPTWTHYVDGARYAIGKLECEVEEGNYLVIDNTSYPYLMKIYNSDNQLVRDVYSTSDFASERFLSIQNGHNVIAISNELGSEIDIRAEVYLQYETV